MFLLLCGLNLKFLPVNAELDKGQNWVYVTLGGMMGLGRLKVEGSKLLFQSSPNFSLRNLCIFFHLPVLLFGGEGGGSK